MPKKCSNYHTSALISQASKVILKILQAILQQYMNHELSDVQAGFRNLWPRNQRSNCQHLMEHRKSKRVPKNIYFCLLTTPKPLPVWITTNCGFVIYGLSYFDLYFLFTQSVESFYHEWLVNFVTCFFCIF